MICFKDIIFTGMFSTYRSMIFLNGWYTRGNKPISHAQSGMHLNAFSKQTIWLVREVVKPRRRRPGFAVEYRCYLLVLHYYLVYYCGFTYQAERSLSFSLGQKGFYLNFVCDLSTFVLGKYLSTYLLIIYLSI